MKDFEDVLLRDGLLTQGQVERLHRLEQRRSTSKESRNVLPHIVPRIYAFNQPFSMEVRATEHEHRGSTVLVHVLGMDPDTGEDVALLARADLNDAEELNEDEPVSPTFKQGQGIRRDSYRCSQ